MGQLERKVKNSGSSLIKMRVPIVRRGTLSLGVMPFGILRGLFQTASAIPHSST